MTIREIVYEFLEQHSAGIPTDDTRLRPRRVYSAVKAARARILADASERGPLSEYNYTTLGCVPLVQTSAHECGCIQKGTCRYYKTKCKLPQTVTANDKLIRSVTTPDGSIQFSQISWERVKYSEYDSFTASNPKYFVRNGYLYLINVPEDLTIITVTGLFEDILDLSSDCYKCEQTDCTSALDKEFSIDRKYVPRLHELTRFMLFGVQGKNDKTNDGKEENADNRIKT